MTRDFYQLSGIRAKCTTLSLPKQPVLVVLKEDSSEGLGTPIDSGIG